MSKTEFFRLFKILDGAFCPQDRQFKEGHKNIRHMVRLTKQSTRENKLPPQAWHGNYLGTLREVGERKP